MSNQLRTSPRRAIVRAPGVIAHYPCFQANTDTSLIDRSGAGNGAGFGADSVAANAWAAANRYTVQADATGTKAMGAFLPWATVNWNMATESLILATVWNGAAATNRWIFGWGGNSAAAVQGFMVKSDSATNAIKLQYSDGTTAAVNANAGATVVADGTDHHVLFVWDGPAKRFWVYVDGAPDLTMNQSTNAGFDFTAAAAAMTPANFGPLVIGGVPHSASKHMTYAATMYGALIAKRTGSVPSNMATIARRLARHPLQVPSSTEWPA